MVPVARQDAVLDAAMIEWETHVRAPIVQCEHVPALVHEENRAMSAVHNDPPLGFQLLEAARAHEIRGRSIHGLLIRQASAAAPFSKRLPRMSIQPPTYPPAERPCRITTSNCYRFPRTHSPAARDRSRTSHRLGSKPRGR